MPPPVRPYNENLRMAGLRSSGLLESGQDPELDTIVIQAASIFGTPIAAITLLDRTRQHFKASVGIGVPYTSRDEAFCGYAILGTEPLIVLNAQSDPRFADNKLVTSPPNIRFYAGVAIFGSGGLPFGALCVIDVVMRPEVSDILLASLTDMASSVSGIFARRAMGGRSPF